jgi:hypothetical protein
MRLTTFLVAAGLATGGAVPALAQSVEGFGRDIPFSLAVRQIAPAGAKVSYGNGVDVRERVTWEGGADWRRVLDSVATSRGYVVTYAGRSIRITRQGDPNPPIEPGRAVQQVAAAGQGGIVFVPYRGPAAAAPAATAGGEGWKPYAGPAAPTAPSPPPAPAAWRADKDASLRGLLEAWGARSGWSIVWKSQYEYRLQAGAQFSGDFVQAAGELVRSVGEVQPRINVTFFKGNRVLVVSNDGSAVAE